MFLLNSPIVVYFSFVYLARRSFYGTEVSTNVEGRSIEIEHVKATSINSIFPKYNVSRYFSWSSSCLSQHWENGRSQQIVALSCNIVDKQHTLDSCGAHSGRLVDTACDSTGRARNAITGSGSTKHFSSVFFIIRLEWLAAKKFDQRDFLDYRCCQFLK